MKKFYYVYTYKNPLNNEVFYVGKGRNDRYKSHLSKSHNENLNFYINILYDSGLEPIVEKVYTSNSEPEVLKEEKRLIDKYKLHREGGSLCNYMSEVSSNTRITIPDDVLKLLGTMTDKELSRLTGFNWSTLRDHRRYRGIPSYKSKLVGTSKLGDYFRKDDNIYKIFNCNGYYVEGTRYDLESLTGLSAKELTGMLFKLRKGSKHSFGWSFSDDVYGKVTPYLKREITDLLEDKPIGKMTYKELALVCNVEAKVARSLFTRNTKVLLGRFTLTNSELDYD